MASRWFRFLGDLNETIMNVREFAGLDWASYYVDYYGCTCSFNLKTFFFLSPCWLAPVCVATSLWSSGCLGVLQYASSGVVTFVLL